MNEARNLKFFVVMHFMTLARHILMLLSLIV